jgi:hypothetical protein
MASRLNSSGEGVSSPESTDPYQPAPAILPNIAPGKIATANSTYSGYSAQNAIDEVSFGWGSNGLGDGAYLEVTLGSLHRLSRYEMDLECQSDRVMQSWSFQHYDEINAGWVTIDHEPDNSSCSIGRDITALDTKRLRILVTPPVRWNFPVITRLRLFGYKLILKTNGDLAGSGAVTQVAGLKGFPIENKVVAVGDQLSFSGSQWALGPAAGAAGAFSGARAYHTGQVQSYPDGSTQAVQFNATHFDTNGFFNPAFPTRLTVPTGKGGFYQASCNLRFDTLNATTAGVNVLLRKNGTATWGFNVVTPYGGSRFAAITFPVLELAEGDYVELSVLNATGSAMTIDSSAGGTAAYSPEFSLVRLG